ncbi:MAG TPA: sugar ABC transporter substrate-binding protein [Galbitalea sp.]|nr:sugar ABC transporter substrate-binding protein [Galbitalea sp.]
MQHKKWMAAAAVAAAGALALAGCSSSAPPKASAPVTITYTNFISAGGNEANLTTIVKAFEKANPNITVKVDTVPYTNYDTKLQTDLAAGTASDVFDIDGVGNYLNYQANGQLAQITGADASLYSAALLDSYQTGDKQYGLPTSFSAVILYYNKALFDAAGVSYPSSSWTWSDEMAAAKKISDPAKGVFGLYQPVTYNEFYKVLVQNGGSFLNQAGTKVAFNNAKGVAAANWLVQKSGTVMPTVAQGQGTPNDDTNLFLAGKLGMDITGTWEIGAFAKAVSPWDIAVEPGNTKQASATFSNAVGIAVTSKHKDAAEKWAEYLSSSKEEVNVRISKGWELPTIANKTQLAQYLKEGAPDNRQAVFDAAKSIAQSPVLGSNGNQIQDIMTNELVEAQAGRSTVAQALAAAASQINALLGQ